MTVNTKVNGVANSLATNVATALRSRPSGMCARRHFLAGRRLSHTRNPAVRDPRQGHDGCQSRGCRFVLRIREY
jgi:hypothetical protein